MSASAEFRRKANEAAYAAEAFNREARAALAGPNLLPLTELAIAHATESLAWSQLLAAEE